ncbi:MAG: NAD(P)/FAD-dependent oxidoreductase [Verrucomicrobiota bacterium]
MSLKARARNRDESVIVVGAGVAGLGAAELLKEGGYEDVTLLEARDRVGGRVWTSRDWREPVDLGASWIHGPRGNPITRLAREAGVRTAATDFEDVNLYNSSGQLMSLGELKRISQLERKVYANLESGSGRKGESLGERFERVFEGLSENDRAVAEFVVNSVVEQSFAEDVERLHPRVWEFGKEFGGGDVLFPDGYSGVFATRFEKLDVRTGHVVKEVRWDGEGVVLVTNRGEFQADRVIVTLPLGVLKKGSVLFSPGLPEGKLAAVEKMGMGCLNKLYLKFPEVFWPEDVQGFAYQAAKVGQWSQWLNCDVYSGAPILVGYNAGSFARELERLSDEEVLEGAMGVLRKLFGRSIPEPIAFQRTRWATDPFSLGSYSARRPGVSRAMLKELGEPVGGRLFFAGEATSLDYPSTVHGAYLSGQREAERVMAM